MLVAALVASIPLIGTARRQRIGATAVQTGLTLAATPIAILLGLATKCLN